MKPFQILIVILFILFAVFPFHAPPATASTNDTCISEWTPVPMPVPASGNPVLLRASSSASDNVWAVGFLNTQTLIEHWNGEVWSIVPSPNVDGHSNRLTDVADLSETDAWAVGTSVDADGVSHLLLQHWDGGTWSIVSPPQGFDGASELVSVSGTVSDDVWAVGTYEGSSLILHWNGADWQNVPSPLNGSFTRVISKASDDVWALGVDADYKATILHWDGSVWSIFTSFQLQNVDLGGPYFFRDTISDFVVVAASDIWVVGYLTGHNIYYGLLWHWDGSIWSGSDPTSGPTPDGPMFGIAGSRSDNLWSISNYYGDTIFAHRTGTGWTEFKLQNLVGGAWLDGITQVSNNEFWVVGHGYPGLKSVHGIFTCTAPPSEQVTLLSPAEGQLISELKPTFEWQDTADTAYYNLQWSPNQPGAYTRSYVYLPGPTLAWPDYFPPENGEHSWSVQACNFVGCTEWSEPVTWTQQVPTPQTPKLLSPPSGASIAFRSVTTTWTPDPQTEYYDLELYQHSLSEPPSGIFRLHENSYLLELQDEGLYYWRVQACNPGGCSDWSDIFEFTIFFPAPPRPVLISPAAKVVLNKRRPVLKWQSSSDDAAYVFQIRNDSRKGQIVIKGGAGIQEQVQLKDPLPYGQYYWRVKACNAVHRCSKWSKGRKFIIEK